MAINFGPFFKLLNHSSGYGVSTHNALYSVDLSFSCVYFKEVFSVLSSSPSL